MGPALPRDVHVRLVRGEGVGERATRADGDRPVLAIDVRGRRASWEADHAAAGGRRDRGQVGDDEVALAVVVAPRSLKGAVEPEAQVERIVGALQRAAD